MGRVLSKHHYKLSYNIYAILRPIAGAILSLVTLRTRKAAYHLAVAKGRVFGLLPCHTLKLRSLPFLWDLRKPLRDGPRKIDP
jgi:hypothetical protein